MGEKTLHSFVEDEVVGFFRINPHRGREQKLTDSVGVHPCTVEDPSGCQDFGFAAQGDRSVSDGNAKSVLCFLNICYLCGETDFTAVCQGVFKGCDPDFPRLDSGGIGAVQSHIDFSCKVWLQSVRFLTGNQFQSRNMILKSVFVLLFQNFSAFGAVAEHQGTASGNGNSQFLAQKRKIHISFYAETAFQCVGFIVVTCINNGSICSGNTHADVVFFLNQKNFELVPGEGPGCHTAQHTASDDTDVCMKGTTHIEWFPDAPECIPQAFPDVPGKRRFSG